MGGLVFKKASYLSWPQEQCWLFLQGFHFRIER